jgi:hypothetical protein
MEDQVQAGNTAKKDFTLPLLFSGIFSLIVCVFICVAGLVWSSFTDDGPQRLVLETIEPTPIPVLCPGIPTDWVAIIKDDFSANPYVWYLGESADEYSTSNTTISKGVLRFDLKAHQENGVYFYHSPARNRSNTDFYFTSNIRQVAGDSDTEYGLTFRVSEGRQHFFSISNDGGFYLKTLDEKGKWKDFIFGKHSEYIHADGENQLDILAQADHFTMPNIPPVDSAWASWCHGRMSTIHLNIMISPYTRP